MKKTLIFLTAEFPYGKGEAFIEHEFPYLAAAFDRIYILTNHPLTGPVRPTAPHVTVSHFPYELSRWDKLLAIKGLLAKEVWEEVRIIRQQYGLRLSRGIWNTLLLSWHKAGKIPLPDPENGPVWVYSYWCNDMALGAARWKKKYGKGMAFCRAHGWDVYMERSVLGYLPFRAFLAQHLDQLCMISENGKQYFKQKIGDFPSLQVQRLGTPRQCGHLPQKIDHQAFTLVSCSSVIPLKRVHLIIEALAAWPLEKKMHWTHVGGGPLWENIQDLAAQLLQSHPFVTYHFAGPMRNADLLQFYQTEQPDLFVNVSETEGVPVSIMEAFSVGIPALATDVGGVGELVNEGNGALLSAQATPADIVQKIQYFSELTDEKMQAYRQAAFGTWEEKCAADRVFPEFVGSLMPKS